MNTRIYSIKRFMIFVRWTLCVVNYIKVTGAGCSKAGSLNPGLP